MINELYELSRSLKRHGLLQPTTHPDVGRMGKYDCLVFELGEDGLPCGLRWLEKQQTAALWKHSKGNHNSFPAIRLQHPLLPLSQSERMAAFPWAKARLTERIDMLSALDCTAANPDCTEIRMSEWTLQKLQPVIKSEERELAALKKLIRLFPGEDSRADFVQRAAALVKSRAMFCQQPELLDFFKRLLTGSRDAKTQKFVSGCMLYFDLPPSEEMDNLVASEQTRQALVKALNAAAPAQPGKCIVSPLSGRESEAVGDKYPNPNLPLLGLTYLYSKKADVPCLTRYALSGADAFQTGKAEISAISDALAFLTQESRNGKSWRAMIDSNRDGTDLLLAYLPDDPQNNACLARILGDPSGYDGPDELRETAEAVYEALCRQVLGNVEDVLQKNSQARVNLILLETLDPGRKQVAYETSLTAKRLCENILAWDAASKNCPPVEIRIREKGGTREVGRACPGPMEICRLLKVWYTRSGASKPGGQSAASLQEIYRLYMPAEEEERPEELIDRFLELTVRRSLLLLGDIGCQLTREYALPSAKPSLARADCAAGFVALLSILLYFRKIRKETYMLDAAFNIGQFLKLADLLHREYCIQVRNGGNKAAPLPTCLMGNEMLAVAAEDPVEGLNRLRERMKIYLAWAGTATGKDSGLAKWILARFEEISLKIARQELPRQFGPAEQAQVLLGYLSAIPYEKKNTADDSEKEEKK